MYKVLNKGYPAISALFFITFNYSSMLPADIGIITINWLWIMQFLAILTGGVFYYKQCQKWLPNWSLLRIFTILFSSVILAYLGSRLFSVLEAFLLIDDGSFAFSDQIKNGGLRWYGAICLNLLALPFILRIGKQQATEIMRGFDIIFLSTCLGVVVGKLGCLFSGHGCYGIYTNLPWGMHFVHGEFPSLLPVHPTPLYDSITHLLIFLFLYRMHRKGVKAGQVFFTFIALSALSNFLIEIIRINLPIWGWMSLAQVVYMCLFLGVGLWYCYPNFKKTILSYSRISIMIEGE